MRISWIVTLSLGSMLRVTAQHSIAYVDGNRAEWKRDLVYIEAPAYPAVAKRWHVKGTGRFRVSVDSSTGRVTDVSMLKSTGFGVLDGMHHEPGSPGRHEDLRLQRHQTH